jgi:hypothetical protein
VDDPSVPAVIEMVNEAISAYEYVPASETKMSSPSEVIQVISVIKVGKAPGSKGFPNKVLKYLLKRDNISHEYV